MFALRSDNPPLTRPAVLPKIEYMSSLADIIAQETQDGRLIVRFLLSAMDGDLPDFLPCHRIDAAKELLQRGFEYLPDDPDAQAEAEPEPEPTPEELEARRRAELMEFSNHGPVYYKTRPFPCVCEDRLHDCKGNLLDEQQLAQVARRPPAMEYLLRDPDQMDRFLARYAEYLKQWNAEHPGNPIDINRFVWTNPTWRHFNNRPRAPAV